MNIGWVLLSWVFFNTRSMPEFKEAKEGDKSSQYRTSR